jgi:hypothetical protein
MVRHACREQQATLTAHTHANSARWSHNDHRARPDRTLDAWQFRFRLCSADGRNIRFLPDSGDGGFFVDNISDG